MDLNDPNFFRLNYLCLNRNGSLGSQSVIIEKRSIPISNKILRVKSGTTSLTKKVSAPKYNKINNSQNLLKEQYSNNNKQVVNRAKSNNRKVFNNIYQSYYSENKRVNSSIDYPIALSPTTKANRENKQKNCNLNLYNEIVSKKNNNRYSRIRNEPNYIHQNINSGNIINNDFTPLTEAKYNYLNNNNTYFNTNFVFKIDNGSNNNKNLYRGSSYRQTSNKKRSQNLEKFFGINTNINNINSNNNYFSHNYNNSNYNIINSNNINNINNKKSIKNKNKNNYEVNKISNKLDNNSCLIDNKSFKSDFSKKFKNKKDFKLIVNSLKKENSSQNKIKIKNFNKNRHKQ